MASGEADTEPGAGELPPPAQQDGLAVAACAWLLLAAFTNCSLTGLVFLAAFGVWGGLCAADAPARSSGNGSNGQLRHRVAAGLWSFVAALAGIVLAAQVALQTAYFLGNMHWAESDRARLVLQLLGFPKVRSTWDLALAVLPPLLCSIAAAAEAHAARGGGGGFGRPASEPHLDHLDGSLRATYALVWAAGYTNAGVVSAVACVLAGLAQPSLLGLPYVAATAAGVWRWGRRRGSAPPRAVLLTGQLYAAAHILVLYLWQIALLRPHAVHRAASWLGLYILSSSEPLPTLAPQLLHLTALVALFSALGYHAGDTPATAADDPSTRVRARLSYMMTAPSTAATPARGRTQRQREVSAGSPDSDMGLWWGGPLEAPSPGGAQLQTIADRSGRQQEDAGTFQTPQRGAGDWGDSGGEDDWGPEPPAAASWGRRASHYMRVLIPGLAGSLVQLAEALSSRPVVAAVALAAFALASPSVLAAVLLLVALWVLLTPSRVGQRLLAAAAPAWTMLLLAWLLAAYAATALAPVRRLPPLAHAAGLYAFGKRGPPLGPLLGMLLAAVALAGLQRSRLRPPEDSEEAGGEEPLQGGSPSRRQLAAQSSSQWGDRLQAAIQLVASPAAGQRPAGISPRASVSGGTIWQPLLGGASADGDPEGQDVPATTAQDEGALAALLLSLGRTAWLAGFVAVPAAFFWAGATAWDPLHGVYLAMLAALMLWHTLQLQPQASLAILPRARWSVLRGYAALHLLGMYVAVVAALPGLHVRQQLPHPAKHALRLLGLWDPAPAAMLPVLVAMLLALLHASLGAWLREVAEAEQQQDGGDREAPSALALPAPLLWVGRMAVAFGSLVVVLLGYFLLLWDTPVSLIGLAYLLLLAALFVGRPLRGRFCERDAAGHYLGPSPPVARSILHRQRLDLPDRHRLVMLGSGAGRWAIAATLAAFAFCDGAAQYLAAATPLVGALALPSSTAHFLQEVVGLIFDRAQPPLQLQLARAALLLGALQLYRFCFVVGCLAEQAAHGLEDEAAAEARRLGRQASLHAFVKRAVILHGGKLVALAAWWAAAQRPGAIGWAYAAGLVGAAPLFGGPRSNSKANRALFRSVLAATDALTMAWLLGQYAFQVTWLRHFLGKDMAAWLVWAGLRAVPPKAAALEAVLRMKFLLLFAITLKRRSFRWLERMPQALKDAAGPGAPVALFWPSAQEGARAAAEKPWGGFFARLRASPGARTLRLALQDLTGRLQTSANRVLTAVDWPPAAAQQRPGSADEPTAGDSAVAAAEGAAAAVDPRAGDLAEARQDLDSLDPAAGQRDGAAAPGAQAGAASEAGSGGEAQERLARWTRQLSVFRFAVQDWTERLWQDWGMEICMAALLLSAFLYLNALSLVFLICIGAGMAAPEAARRRVWAMVVLPLLGGLLLYQYTVLIGLPPGVHWSTLRHLLDGQHPGLSPGLDPGQQPGVVLLPGHGVARHHRPPGAPPTPAVLKDWLGLGTVDRAALWALFFAWGISVIQVHWAASHPPVNRGRPVTDDALPGLYQPPSDAGVRAPLLQGGAGADSDGAVGDASRRANGSGGCANGVGPQLWAPLEYDAMPRWRWVDWCRYLFYRHYTDAVLIALVALCTLENDVIHAGYLALALLFFRRRDELRMQRNRMFKWLPVYNFLVMFATLAYQAPFERLFGRYFGPDDKSDLCNLPHLAGLYKMVGFGGHLAGLSARGAVADMLLWAIARVQTRVFASASYRKAMEVVSAEAAADAAAAAEHTVERRRAQEQAALAASRLRRMRAQRVRRLKAGVSRRKGGVYNVDPMLLDFAPEVEDDLPVELSGTGEAEDSPVAREAQLHGTFPSSTALDKGVEQVADAAASLVSPQQRGSQQPPQPQPRSWLSQLGSALRGDDRQAFVVYLLFFAVFVADFSLLTLVYPLSLLGYALLSQKPKRQYWLAVLMYTEAVLIGQYIWLIPTRLNCSWVTPLLRTQIEEVGLHQTAVSCLPLFVLYLGTLMHTYSLAYLEAGAAAVDSPATHDIESGHKRGASSPPRGSGRGAGSAAGAEAPASGPRRTGSTVLQSAQAQADWLHRTIDTTASAALATFEFFARVTTTSERPLYFVLLEAAPRTGGSWASSEGQRALQAQVRAVLEHYTASDLAAARARQRRRQMELTERDGDSLDDGPGLIDMPRALQESSNAASGHSGRFVDLSTVGPLAAGVTWVRDRPGGGAVALLEVTALRATPATTGGYSGVAGWPLRSLQPAQHVAETLLRFQQDQQQGGHAGGRGASFEVLNDQQPSHAPHSQPADMQQQRPQHPPQQPSPRPPPDSQHRSSGFPAEIEPATSGSGLESQQSAGPSGLLPTSSQLLRSNAQPQTLKPHQQRQQQSAGAGGLLPTSSQLLQNGQQPQQPQQPRQPRRSPAAGDGPAEVPFAPQPPLPPPVTPRLRRRSTARAHRHGSAAGDPPDLSVELQVVGAEPHAQMEQDWYMLTVAADLLAFLYAALFYQMVLQSSKTLADLTEQRVIPADYLYCLIALFLCLVLDRVFYTTGQHLGKALLLAGQAALVYWYCLSLYWSPLEDSGAARSHLRVFAALKSLVFVFSALQLRSGYPPPASYQGGRGRHSFVFTRSTGMVSWLGFQVFAAVPFVYELREILDWSATATTLRLYDWLKLEDISMSLYFVTVSQKSRDQRSLGQRVPRYQKLVQGALLFVGLLVLLWVPLLIFSTGNPTFQTPGIQAFAVNASIVGADDRGRAASFPLWSGGGRRVLSGALDNDTLPPGLEGQYTADQIRLMCVAEDADQLWAVTPPAEAALRQLLKSHAAELRIGWRVERTAPPASAHGGPACDGSVAVRLAGASRSQLLDVLDGNRSSAQLMALNASDPHGSAPGAAGHRGLYGLFWRFAGDACAVQPDVVNLVRGADDFGWDQQLVGCGASLQRASDDGSRGDAWWQLACGVLDSQGRPANATAAGLLDCPHSARGPRIIGIMERVQSGLLGQTVSAFGITGLYISFVYALGRFLRLSISNMRMRIPYDDLPNTSRLIALCQDIYIARAEGELALEEQLYWALISVYRQPHIMFELTKKND